MVVARALEINEVEHGLQASIEAVQVSFDHKLRFLGECRFILRINLLNLFFLNEKMNTETVTIIILWHSTEVSCISMKPENS